MRKLSEWLLARDRNAAAVAFIFTLVSLLRMPFGGLLVAVLGFLAAIIVGLVTLQKGARSGFVVLVWVALPAVSMLFLRRFGVFDVMLFRAALVWIVAVVLQRTASWRLVLEVITILGLLGILAAHAVVADPSHKLAQMAISYLKTMAAQPDMKAGATEMIKAVKLWSPALLGAIAFLFVLGSIVQLLLARWWQNTLFYPGKMRQEMTTITAGRSLAILLLLVIVGAFLRWPVALNALPIMVLPFVFAGLGVLHHFVESKEGSWVILLLVYFAVIILWYLALFVAGIGYVDSWISLRKKRILS